METGAAATRAADATRESLKVMGISLSFARKRAGLGVTINR
jgi:hypothetical protein